MIWDAKNAKALEAFAGTYSLPGGCWAVLSLTRSPPKDASTLAAYPEGYRYTWAILAPGEPPSLRGHRMAGVDNSDDKHVRSQVNANPFLGKHRAHRHLPNWKDIQSVRGQGWPVAGLGMQLPSPPETPLAFWMLCMDCLERTFSELGLGMPAEGQLFENHLSEQSFREIQRELKSGL